MRSSPPAPRPPGWLITARKWLSGAEKLRPSVPPPPPNGGQLMGEVPPPQILQTVGQGLPADLLSLYYKKYDASELANLQSALEFLAALGIDLTSRALGAELLLDWNTRPDTIAAFLLSAVEDRDLPKNLAPDINIIIYKMNMLNAFSFNPALGANQGTNFIRMLMLREADPEIIFLIVAELFQELAQTSDHPAAERVLSSFVPFLQLLGYDDHAAQLADLAFLHVNPLAFRSIETSFSSRYGLARAAIVAEVKEFIGFLQDRITIPNHFNWRLKSIYSEAIKELSRPVTDYIGLRFVVHNGEACYALREEIRNILLPLGCKLVPGQSDDYIANPRPTGYQALHDTFVHPRGWQMEIQIRSESMHQEAEIGSCSHLRYKLGAAGFALSSLQSTKAAARYQQLRQAELAKGIVFVYDGDGRLHKIGPVSKSRAGQSPTVLDYAFHLGRDFGSRISSAQVWRINFLPAKPALLPFNATLEPGDVLRLSRLAEEPIPISDGRCAAATTELARAALALLARGNTLNSRGQYDDLRQAGEKAFGQALTDWQQTLAAILKLPAASAKEPTVLYFSLLRIFKKLGFLDEGTFYTALGLNSQLITEALALVQEASILVHRSNHADNKKLSLLFINYPGVFSRLITLFVKHHAQIHDLTFSDGVNSSYQKMNLELSANNDNFNALLAALADLYKHSETRQAAANRHFKLIIPIKRNNPVDQLKNLVDFLGRHGVITGGNFQAGFLHIDILGRLEVSFHFDFFSPRPENAIAQIKRLSKYSIRFFEL